MNENPEIEIHQQTAFGDDGQLEVTEFSVETSLEDFGADVDHRECDSRIDRPEAAEFGVDDRPEVTRSSESDQPNLFAETAEYEFIYIDYRTQQLARSYTVSDIGNTAVDTPVWMANATTGS